MSGRHVCQFRAAEREALATELRTLVERLNESHSRTPKVLSPDCPPNFLREKVPRYKPNPDTVPLITHTAFIEVRPTADPNLVEQTDNTNTLFFNIGQNANPYKSDWENQDSYCRNICGGNSANMCPTPGGGRFQLCCTPVGPCQFAQCRPC